MPLRSPHRRHLARHVDQRTGRPNGEWNTVILPGVDVAADVAAINRGVARRVGNTYIINGRTYGFHNGRLYPMHGEGLVRLTRNQYRALAVLNSNGNTPRTQEILDKMSISEPDRERALEVHEITKRAKESGTP